MKYLIKLLVLLALPLFFSACENCVDCLNCTGPFGTDYEGTTICEDDLGNKALYNAAVSLAEDDNLGGGCTCE